MTRALVVYESMFGNTHTIANAVADGLGEELDVEVVEVSTAPTTVDGGVTLLVVGGPTHAFGMSREESRQEADERAEEPIESSSGLREWIGGLTLPEGLLVTTFDTRIDKHWVPGSASAPALRRLKRLGGTELAEPERFDVTDTEGPLAEGEESRARQWGRNLASLLPGH